VVIPNSAPYTLQDVVTGFLNLTCISSLQLGYQIWSIPMGCFYVPETLQMLIHHVCVVFCCIMTATFTTGFRYYTPFFFGVMEISSLPLAIMNTMKDNPTFCRNNPTTYLATRVIFAAVFLFIRVYMVIPRKTRYLTDHYLLWSNATIPWFQGFMSFVFCCSTFLLVLQLYWAVLIVRGILKQFVFKHFKKNKSRHIIHDGFALNNSESAADALSNGHHLPKDKNRSFGNGADINIKKHH
jgi:hypothetical protein